MFSALWLTIRPALPSQSQKSSFSTPLESQPDVLNVHLTIRSSFKGRFPLARSYPTTFGAVLHLETPTVTSGAFTAVKAKSRPLVAIATFIFLTII